LRLLKMAASFQQLWVTLQASQFCRKSDCWNQHQLKPCFWRLTRYLYPNLPSTRQPIPLTQVDERIGTHAINIDPAKIVGIVITTTSRLSINSDTTRWWNSRHCNHLIAFFEKEVAEGRLPKNLVHYKQDRFNCQCCINRS
jgi:hypothetical protein